MPIWKGLTTEAHGHAEDAPDSGGGADHLGARVAIGQPGEGQGGQHEDHAAETDQAEQHGVGDVEALLDVGAQHQQCHPLELLDHVEQQQQHDHRGPAGPQSFAQRHRSAPDPGQEIVGEDQLLSLSGAQPVGLLLHDHRCQRCQPFALRCGRPFGLLVGHLPGSPRGRRPGPRGPMAPHASAGGGG